MLRSLARIYGLATQLHVRNVHPTTGLGNTVITRGKKSRAKKEKATTDDSSFSEDTDSLDILKYEKNMKQTIDALQSNYARLRTDGASPGILDGTQSTIILSTYDKHSWKQYGSNNV